MAAENEMLRDLIHGWLYDPSADRDAIAAALPDDADDPRGLVRSCLERARAGREPGVHLDERFEMSHLRGRYPDERLNFCVPGEYDPAEPMGLLVLLHGGGSDTPREAAQKWFANDGGYPFGDVLAEMPCITVAPGNLLLPTHKRWSNPQSDAYVLAVIEEASYRYNIDPDRVCIAGQSMGGFGACHIVQTIGDRFATVGCHAGAWYYGFWEGLRGVDFYLMQGVNDFVPGRRPPPRWPSPAWPARSSAASTSRTPTPSTRAGTRSPTHSPATASCSSSTTPRAGAAIRSRPRSPPARTRAPFGSTSPHTGSG